MTRRKRSIFEDADFQALQRRIYAVQTEWQKLHVDVRGALIAAGVKLSPDQRGICLSLNKVMIDCEADGDPGCPEFDRAEFLCAVTLRMLSIERQKFITDRQAWLMRHHSDLLPAPKTEKPRRRLTHAEE